MSWFRSTPQSPTRDPSQTESGEYKPLDRNERQACWAARDAYFACLDRNDILNPLKDGAKATSKCGKESEAFDRDCAASWVRYFKEKRVSEWEKEQKLKRYAADGALPVQQAQKPWYKVW